MNDKERNDLQLTISHALQEKEAEAGDKFDLSKVNLEELRRRTGIPRKKLRLIKKNGFIVKPHGLSGTRKKDTVLSDYTETIDTLLRSGVSNSIVIKDRIEADGYVGGLTQVKDYISGHKDLIPAKRHAVAAQGNRGRRYTSEPGESVSDGLGLRQC